jgi:hypothetical protein
VINEHRWHLPFALCPVELSSGQHDQSAVDSLGVSDMDVLSQSPIEWV